MYVHALCEFVCFKLGLPYGNSQEHETKFDFMADYIQHFIPG
jgi:hypothetical protein